MMRVRTRWPFYRQGDGLFERAAEIPDNATHRSILTLVLRRVASGASSSMRFSTLMRLHRVDQVGCYPW